MSRSGPILVPVDFSADSIAALEWAAETSRCLGAPLVLVHVLHDPYDAPGLYAPDATEAGAKPMLEVAQAMTAEFVERMRREHPDLPEFEKLETRVLVGLPATRIVELAELLDARLIVMGSRGRTGLQHLLVGSKAERVVQLAPMPVTIVKAEAPAEEQAPA